MPYSYRDECSTESGIHYSAPRTRMSPLNPRFPRLFEAAMMIARAQRCRFWARCVSSLSTLLLIWGVRML
jgi:hypothetical protein